MPWRNAGRRQRHQSHRLGRQLLCQPRRCSRGYTTPRQDQSCWHWRKVSAQRSGGQSRHCQCPPGLSGVQMAVWWAMLCGSLASGGACQTALIGQHQHEKSGLPRCPLRRGTDRARHRGHHVAQDDRKLPRAWQSPALHRGPAKRGESASGGTRRRRDPLRRDHSATARGGGAEFIDSFQKLVGCIENKRKVLQS